MREANGERVGPLAFILLTLFIDILGIGIVIPVLPQLIKQFLGGSTSSASTYYGIIGATYAFMQFLFAPIMGALSDRFGRRPVLLASLFGLGVDFLLQGFAPNIAWLFAGRLLAGAMGASITTANAYVADISTPTTRARNFGFVGMMFGLGFIFGPTLGGLLGSIHLRLPFFVSAGLALVNWLYGFFVLPESLPPEQRGEFRLAKVNPLGTLGRLQAYPVVASLATALVCMTLAQRGLEHVWVLFTNYRFGWDERTNGLALGLVGLMAVIVQGGLVRPILARLGERRTVMSGIIVSAITFTGYGLVPAGWMMPCFIVFGALGGVTGPAVQTIVTGSVKPSEQGAIQGALTSLQSLTNIFAPLIFATGLFRYFSSARAFVHLPGAPFLVGACLWLVALAIVHRALPADELTRDLTAHTDD